jgi:hypothetical protein
MMPYHAYLLRLWSDGDSPQQWRFSLEDPHTHTRRGFASLDELLAFLQKEIVHAAAPPDEATDKSVEVSQDRFNRPD